MVHKNQIKSQKITGGERHIRISFGLEEKELKEGLERLVNFLEKNF